MNKSNSIGYLGNICTYNKKQNDFSIQIKLSVSFSLFQDGFRNY